MVLRPDLIVATTSVECGTPCVTSCCGAAIARHGSDDGYESVSQQAQRLGGTSVMERSAADLSYYIHEDPSVPGEEPVSAPVGWVGIVFALGGGKSGPLAMGCNQTASIPKPSPYISRHHVRNHAGTGEQSTCHRSPTLVPHDRLSSHRSAPPHCHTFLRRDTSWEITLRSHPMSAHGGPPQSLLGQRGRHNLP